MIWDSVDDWEDQRSRANETRTTKWVKQRDELLLHTYVDNMYVDNNKYSKI